ncbi:hypothetical protein QNO00_03685 [Arthrobacter sp. zg-Y1219]|uniref:hypothetical protein n=1 Tax=Arthrobacter sp. zg-Y1219 TaxID=3049067 RepID=UPI0024C2F555|nr:hypothetical protein [Arthrobacter sp. zg-Y1219]MDK1359366.1 hypothetical protein [Arthrobacter sp. zg-Y1219]
MDTVADADANTKDKPPPPWYLRGKSLIIGAGAVATAITAVLGLWDRFDPPDDKDTATVELLQLLRASDLRDFNAVQLGTALPLKTAQDTNARQLPAGGHAAAVPGFSTAFPPNPSLPPAVTVPPTPVPPAVTVPPTPVPGPPATEPETSPPPTFATPSSTSSPSTSAGWTESPEWTEEFELEVVEDPVLTMMGYDLKPEDLRVFPAVGNQSLGLTASTEQAVEPAVGAGTSPAPADVATQIVEMLSTVEGTDSAGNPAPRGWTVAVDLTLEGLEGVPLLLTWSLDGIDVPHLWLAESLAYRVEADTDSAAGTAEIWVPDLIPPGTYEVNVNLIYESTGAPVDSGSRPVPD